MQVRFSALMVLAYLLAQIFICGSYATIAHGQQNPHNMETMGKDQFIENRCVRCHTIGRGRFVGPDLSGVGERYTREDLIKWIENPQQVYQATGKMPVNEGYPPMPPMDIHPMAAQAIADYLLTVKVRPDTGKGGTITGKVVDKTNDKAVSGAALRLTSFMGDKETGSADSTTEEDGSFTFESLPWDRSYMVTVEHNGAEYSTDKLVFYPDEDVKTLDLPVYDPTDSSAGISIAEAHMIVQVVEDGLSVADLSAFDNKGDKMYVGGAELADGKKETLKFSVPKDAANLNFIHGLTPEGVVRTETGFSDTASVPPGPKRVVFAYTMPLGSGSGTLEKTIEYPTASFLLLVSKTNDQVTVDGLDGGDSVKIENEDFIRWSGENLQPGHRITVKFVNPGALKDNIIKWGGIAVLIIAVGGGILYSSLARGKSRETAGEKPAGSRESLIMRRSALIKEIAALDDGYEAGTIDESSYREIRDSKKAELVEVTRRLRF
ncbi:MAG TPA: c-type cytochrome [Thermodesulfobacteriota bacterium]|nr:c-type cytochrome [Thermodesulfobacteriota bacterium]